MEKNMGVADRIIRMVTAIILMDFALDGILPGIWNIFSWLTVADFELTGLIAWSPLYAVFHIHTDSRKKMVNS
jgi:hypothetical protein